ncbi:hypothetical protein BH09BAC4_BH09BAC4_02840 [soil metagenome]
MNPRLIIIIGLLVHSYLAYCQTPASVSTLMLRRHVADIRFFSKRPMESGILFDLDDSTLTLAPIRGLKSKVKALVENYGGRLPATDSVRRFLPLRTYRYSQIRRLTLHRRGHAAKGFLIGMGIGAAAGFISGDDPPGIIAFSGAEKALVFSVPASLVGLVVGAAVTKSVNAKEQSVAAEVPARLRKFTIVEQVKQANLYTP